MFNFFKPKRAPQSPPLTTDIHSHLLPGLDDGVASFEQAKEIILHFQRLGYSKLITTPHVMSDAYRNTTERILSRLGDLRKYLLEQGVTVSLDAAAEYYLDEDCLSNLGNDVPMLTFGTKYFLFETNFLTEPLTLRDFIFQAFTKGYKPVLAHPERYVYIHQDLKKAEDLIDRGVLFQINISSLTGYYSREAQATAHKLIDRGWVHFLGSDCHHAQHANLVEQARNTKYYQKALSLSLLNNTL